MESIEVERKFAADASCEMRLRTLGAALVAKRSFTDTYFDNSSRELTLADFWLRRRNDAWQLKCPPVQRTAAAAAAATREYAELSEPEAILNKLRAKFGGGEPSSNLEEWLASRGCVGFATFATERTAYVVDGVTVDLDVADFGYAVGEAELTVARQEDVPGAVQRVEALCSRITAAGRTSDGSPGPQPPPGGKLEEYMRVHCRDHWDELVRAGLLCVGGSDNAESTAASAASALLDESERCASLAAVS